MLNRSKSLSILLVLLSLIVAGCRGNSADKGNEISGGSAAGEEVNSSTAISSGTVTASLLNIHETPGTDTPIIYQAPAGTEVDIFDETALGDSIWYQVRARSETLPGELGWAFSRYIDTGENSGQNSSAGSQPSTPPSGGGSGTASGGSGGLDPEAPGANPDTPGTIDPEAPGANPDTPGTIDPEAPGANPDTPGTIDPEAPGANPDTPGGLDPEAPGANPDNPGGSGYYPGTQTGGSGSYPGESVGGSGSNAGDDNSRPAFNEGSSRPAVGEE
jgi:hypothetical protein